MILSPLSADARHSAIRTVSRDERAAIQSHLARMTPDDLRHRFGAKVSAGFTARYADIIFDCGTLIFGWYENGCLRGVAELRPLDAGQEKFEAAFTVEHAWQGRQIGSALMKAVVAEARRAGACEIIVCCDRDNRRMQSVAKKVGGLLAFDGGECTGVIQIDDIVLHSFVTPDIPARAISIRIATPPQHAAPSH